jgi:hypothetical protein
MADPIPFYPDPGAESTLYLSVSGQPPILVSQVAFVASRLDNAFDEQKQAGSNFGRVTFIGIQPAEFTVSIIVLPEDEAHFWSKVVPLFRQKGEKGNSPPLDVTNPQINRVGVTTVTCVSSFIDAPHARDGRSVGLVLREWTPAPVKPKPDTSKKKIGAPGSLPASATRGGKPGAVNQSAARANAK